MNYIKAIKEYLYIDPEINALVWDRIEFLRVYEKTETPFIVFTELEQKNDADGKVWENWLDVVHIILDAVVTYQDSYVWRQIRNLLVKKLNWFNGKMTDDRSGNIWRIKHYEVRHNPKSDLVSWQTEFVLKFEY